MALYFLEYDLRKQRDYKTLTDKLKEFGAVRVLESLWSFTRINTSAINLRDYFKQFVDNDDGLMISEVKEWASYNALKSPQN